MSSRLSQKLEGPNRLWALDWQYVGILSVSIAAVGTSRALRLGFLTSEGQDLGFILGAVVGERYRGLQFSFDDRFRDGSPGDVMQGLQIRRLVDEEVLEYDLGTEAPYKFVGQRTLKAPRHLLHFGLACRLNRSFPNKI